MVHALRWTLKKRIAGGIGS
ncbi:hypothetical protein BC937DRAFT_90273 [Endogone sp. FLAS-F59071]|nr:hypothetical protein BC937DRAFT_90273 [Endogone sp. FLAS-F59071]|eukprot:RUS17206.1 hypothetical protein BC937DRAFT_90273 [Endogone sp. FLAS-F59071]